MLSEFRATNRFKKAYEASNLRDGLVKCFYPPDEMYQQKISYGWEKKQSCTLLRGQWVRTIDLPEWDNSDLRW